MAEGVIESAGKLYREDGSAIDPLVLDGGLVVAGQSLTPVDLADLPDSGRFLTGAELVAIENAGVAMRTTTNRMAGSPADSVWGVDRSRLKVADDAIGFTTTVTATDTLIQGTLLRTTLAGAGAQVAQGQTLGEFGIFDVTTGTTTTGRCAIQPSMPLLFLFSNLVYTAMAARLKMPVVSDGTDTYRVVCGLCDMTSATPADGAFFRSPTTAGNWRAIIRDDAADLADIDTGVAVDSNGAFHTFMVEYDPEVSGFRWWIDNNLVAQDLVNEPDSLANLSSLGVSIIKSAGTNSRIVEVDAISWDIITGRTMMRMP